MHYNLHLSSKQNRDDPSILYNFEIEDIVISQLKTSKPGYVGYNNQSQQLFLSAKEIRDKKQTTRPLCLIQITKDCFKCLLNRTEYVTSLVIEKCDWLVIKDSDMRRSRNDTSSFGFRLREGDVLRLGKLCFKIRELSNNAKQTNRSKDKDREINIDNTNTNNNNNEINLKSSPVKECLPNQLLTLKNYNIAKHQGTTCKFCLSTDDTGKNPLISVCKCIGSVKYVHLDCLRNWFSSKIITISSVYLIMHKYSKLKCELCNSTIPDKIRIKKSIISLIDFPRPQTPYLVFEGYPFHKDEQLHLYIINMKDKAFITLGRSNEANIRFTDISISRNHSKIRYHNDYFYIEDLHSKFGTLIKIKSDFVVLPNKKLTVQTGKLLCEFNLIKNFKSTLFCYSNKFLESLDYYKLFDEQKQEMYLQELKTLQTLTGLDEYDDEENNAQQINNQTITKLLTNNNRVRSLMKNTINMNNSDMLNLLNVNVKKQIFHQSNTVLMRRDKRKMNICNQSEEMLQNNLTNRNNVVFSQRNNNSTNNVNVNANGPNPDIRIYRHNIGTQQKKTEHISNDRKGNNNRNSTPE